MSKGEPENSGGEQRARLAVLGKHPGWNDHLDDIGLDAERLVDVKRRLYVDGIGGVINAGTWEAMPEGERDEGFAHTFFWRQADGVVVGRMWSSSDGKGRRKYPMIACVLCRDLPFSFVMGPVLDRLRRLESACVAVQSADEVISESERMRRELADLAAHVPPLTGERVAGGGRPGSAARLADAPELGEDGVGLRRVLYQIERELGGYLRADGHAQAGKSRTVEARGQHIRVPAVGGVVGPGGERDAVEPWARLLLTRLDPISPLLIVTRDGRDWIDVIVGDLTPVTLSCLQAGTASHPYTSDIPFTIEGESAQQIDDAIEASRRGEVEEKDPCYIDVPQDRLAAFLRPRRPEGVDQPSTRGKGRGLLIGVVVVVLIVAVVVAFQMIGKGASSQDGGSDGAGVSEPEEPDPAGRASSNALSDEPEPEPGVVAESAPLASESGAVVAGDDGVPSDEPDNETLPDDPVEAFIVWCTAYERFFVPFRDAFDRATAGADPSLRGGLIASLDAAERAGDAIDPLAMTPGRFRSIETLVESPPDAVREPGFEAVIAEGYAPIRAVRRAISAEAWPTRARLERIVRLADQEGTPAPVQVLALLEGLDSEDGAEAAGAVMRLAEHADVIAVFSGASDEWERARADALPVVPREIADRLRAITVFGEYEQGSPRDVLKLTIGHVEQLVNTAAEARVVVEEGLVERADPTLVAERLAPYKEGVPFADARAVMAWNAAVRDERLHLLDPAADPRRGLPGEDDLARMRAALFALEAGGEDNATREIGGMIRAFADSLADLNGLTWNADERERIVEESAYLAGLAESIGLRMDRLQRERSLDAERYAAEIRATDRVSRTGSATIDSAWVDARGRALAEFDASGDVVALSRAVDEAKERLVSLESAMPRLEIDGAAFGACAERVADAIDRERESRLLEAVGEAERPIAEAPEAYGSWVTDVNQSASAVGTLRDSLGSWRSADEPFVGGGTPVDAAHVWGASWLEERLSLLQCDPDLGAYVLAVSSDDAEELAGLVRADGTPPGAVWAAWERVGGMGIEFDVLASERLRAASALLGEREDAVLERIGSLASERWLDAVRRSGADRFGVLADAADRMGIDGSALPWPARFNLFVHRLRRGLVDGELPERSRLLTDLRGLEAARADGAPGSGGSDALAWIGRFAGELEAREGREIDYREIGPARAGWAVEPFDSGRLLVYSWSGGDAARRLAFRLVDSPEAGVFYLCDTEAPAWLLTEYALAGEHRGAVLSVIPEDWAPLPDTRPGPRAWTWGRARGDRAVRVPRTWLERDGAGDRPVYPDGMAARAGRPSPAHPLQRVSPHAAAVLAATVGCRLPSETEWLAAYASAGSPEPGEAFNLRDRVFDEQRAHTLSLGSGISVVWPDTQTFYAGAEGVPAGPGAESHPWSDGVLWFSEVGSGADRPFRHLVGNVAELVLPSLDDAAGLGDRGGAMETVVAAVVSAGEPVARAVGGSALSPPSVPISEVVAPGATAGKAGYTDAGFRLAFSPGVEEPLIVVVGNLIDGAPFLRVPPQGGGER